MENPNYKVEMLETIDFVEKGYTKTLLKLDTIEYIKKLEKEIESKQKAYDNCYCEFKHYKQFESIPKSIIKEKIEDLLRCVSMSNLVDNINVDEIESQVEILEELLK